MRSLLLHTHNDPNFEARLQVALDLARAFDAHLTLLQAIAYDVIMPGDFYGTLAASMIPVAREAAAEFRAGVEQRLTAEDVRWDWVEEFGMADSRMLQHAALTDLAIVGASPPEGSPRGPSPLAGILAVHCKAPIMVVPDGANGLDITGPAVVAWNGSIESSRALRAALPILERAASVHLISVIDPQEDDETDITPLSGAEYLARHGITCEVVELPRGTRMVHEVLREAARARGASCLVMGAYGRPRLVETLFGGVSRGMLSNTELPMLLAH
jgi:nucleotide-binding universal stress UspA family protein